MSGIPKKVKDEFPGVVGPKVPNLRAQADLIDKVISAADKRVAKHFDQLKSLDVAIDDVARGDLKFTPKEQLAKEVELAKDANGVFLNRTNEGVPDKLKARTVDEALGSENFYETIKAQQNWKLEELRKGTVFDFELPDGSILRGYRPVSYTHLRAHET